MYVTSLIVSELTTLHNTVSHAYETFYVLEARFSTQVTRFSVLAPTLANPDSMSAFYLISIEKVDDSQSITIMAATSFLPGSSESLTPRSAVTSFLAQISDDLVALIIGKCDKHKHNLPSTQASSTSQQPALSPVAPPIAYHPLQPVQWIPQPR